MNHKRGNAFLDIMLVVFVLIGMAIIGIVSKNLLSDVNTDIQADPDISASVKTQTDNLNTRFPDFMDGAFLFATVLLWIFVIVSSVMIESHPMFFVVTLILLVFAFLVVIMLGNTFEEFSAEPEFTGLNADFPITYFIMNNFLVVIIVMGATVLIALYAKNKFVGT